MYVYMYMGYWSSSVRLRLANPHDGHACVSYRCCGSLTLGSTINVSEVMTLRKLAQARPTMPCIPLVTPRLTLIPGSTLAQAVKLSLRRMALRQTTGRRSGVSAAIRHAGGSPIASNHKLKACSYYTGTLGGQWTFLFKPDADRESPWKRYFRHFLHAHNSRPSDVGLLSLDDSSRTFLYLARSHYTSLLASTDFSGQWRPSRDLLATRTNASQPQAWSGVLGGSAVRKVWPVQSCSHRRPLWPISQWALSGAQTRPTETCIDQHLEAERKVRKYLEWDSVHKHMIVMFAL